MEGADLKIEVKNWINNSRIQTAKNHILLIFWRI